MNTVLLLILSLAVAYDLRQRRVPNSLVLAGGVAGLSMAALNGGLPGIGQSLLGMLLGVALFLPFFAIRLVGAGDAKLFGVAGSFVGPSALMPVWIYTLLAGGVLAIFSVLRAGSPGQCLQNMKLLAIGLAYGGRGTDASPASLAGTTSVRIPYALAIAAGVLIWMLRQS